MCSRVRTTIGPHFRLLLHARLILIVVNDPRVGEKGRHSGPLGPTLRRAFVTRLVFPDHCPAVVVSVIESLN